jgi:uncharacterized protein YlxW (UPF0749 family)
MTSTTTEQQSPADGLLEGFLAEVVVDDYAPVSPARGGGMRGQRGWSAVLVSLVIGLLIATALVHTRATDDQRQHTRQALSERIDRLSSTVDERQSTVDDQSQVVEDLQRSLLDSPTADGQAERAAALSAISATTPLAGPGLVVTVDDAPDAQKGSLNRVLDRDLQDIVNALWRMGAAGIAVNDQRLTGATAIRSAGEAILVNYQPLTRPYRVSAIGTTTSGDGDSGLQKLLTSLSDDYGLVTDVTSGDVALPAAQLRSPRYATTTDGEAGQ